MVTELCSHVILQRYEVLILKSQRHTFSQTNNFSQINKFFVLFGISTRNEVFDLAASLESHALFADGQIPFLETCRFRFSYLISLSRSDLYNLDGP